METVEHWWNGSWGTMTRRDVWLERDGQHWYVRVRWGKSEVTRPSYDAEAPARSQLDLLLSERGPWQQVRVRA